VEVFSATTTRHLGDPLKPPIKIGHVYKNPVEPKLAGKLLSIVDQMNNELEQETIRKRKLKKLH